MSKRSAIADRAKRLRYLPVGTICTYNIAGAKGTARVVGYTQDEAAARQEGDMLRYVTYKLKGISGFDEDGKSSKDRVLTACGFEVRKQRSDAGRTK